MKQFIPFFLFLLLLTGMPFPSSGQPLFRKGPFLNGYERGIRGTDIVYHSFDPSVNDALLTRATTGKMDIVWETEPVPADSRQPYATFLWIAGFSSGTSAADRFFDLSVNDHPVLTFTTHPGHDTTSWTVRGSDGSVLYFQYKWSDYVSDVFGYMYLHIPVTGEMKGKPLVLKVTGHEENSNDWYMTFRSRISRPGEITALPVLVRRAGKLFQVAVFSVHYPDIKGKARIILGQDKPLVLPLKLGTNEKELYLPAVSQDSIIPVHIEINGEKTGISQVLLKPVHPRDIFLIHHSHNDIGYVDYQPAIMKLQMHNIQEALRLIRKTDSYPDEARFRWNVEIMWAADSFLILASSKERNEFIRAVREGRIGLQGMYCNVLTGLARPEELIQETDMAIRFGQLTGVPVKSAMISDIPGFTWSIVPALAQAGIRYFSSGPNASDRIGHSTEAWGDRPFWWVSPSGNEKVLFWIAGKGYSLFHGTRTIGNNPNFKRVLFNYLSDLQKNNYPYDMVQVRYTVYSDNGPTDSTLSDFVKNWNEHYASPRLIISTSEKMFSDFEKKYGDQLPAFSGDFTPYWEDGAISSARELGLVRNASERIVQAQIASFILGKKIDEDLCAHAWKMVHLSDEHTWGAHNSISNPDSPLATGQWKYKQAYMTDADSLSEKLLESVLANTQGKEQNPVEIDVINTLSWPRTEVVTIPASLAGTGNRVTGPDGQEVPSQRLADGSLAILVSGIPPLASKKYQVHPGNTTKMGNLYSGSLTLSNGLVSVELDSLNGSIKHLVDLASGYDVVSAAKGQSLNGFFYVPGKDPQASEGPGKTVIHTAESGPLVSSLVVESVAPGCRSLTREVRICKGSDRVYISNRIDKTKIRTKEAVYFGFPFHIQNPVTRIDLGWGFMQPVANQLAGSCMDFFSACRWADISNQDHGVTLALCEAPLIETGTISDETSHNSGPSGWLTTPALDPVLYSFVMNNYWHTNYKADQEGPALFRYVLRPHQIFNATDAYLTGIEVSQPLLVAPAQANTPDSSPLFSLSSRNVAVTSIQISRDHKAIMIRIYNTGNMPENFQIRWNKLHPARCWISDFTEQKLDTAPGILYLPASGILTLRCEE